VVIHGGSDRRSKLGVCGNGVISCHTCVFECCFGQAVAFAKAGNFCLRSVQGGPVSRYSLAKFCPLRICLAQLGSGHAHLFQSDCARCRGFLVDKPRSLQCGGKPTQSGVGRFSLCAKLQATRTLTATGGDNVFAKDITGFGNHGHPERQSVFSAPRASYRSNVVSHIGVGEQG
jgi:hypothetical protein